MTIEPIHLEQAIRHMEAQRTLLGDDVVDVAIATLHEKLAALRRQRMLGAETHMIGRAAELQQVLDVLYRVLTTTAPALVTVSGEPGVGKSRLLSAFRHWIERIPEPIRVLSTGADQQTTSLPYAPMRALIASALHILDSDHAAVARAKLERGIGVLLGPQSVEKAHFIGHLLGFDFSASPYLRGILSDSDQIRSRAIHYTTQLLTALTAEQPVVLLLEDLHWADDDSLDLLLHLAHMKHTGAVLIVGTARAEFFERRPHWDTAVPSHLQLALQPLSVQESQDLVGHLLRKVPHLPTKLRDLIVDRSEGNPFYIEELIKMLIDDGVILPALEQWRVRSRHVKELGVPPTLTEVLRARLAGLPSAERTVLASAAVAGRVFWESAVAFMLVEARPASVHSKQEPSQIVSSKNVRTLLGVLQRKELIVEQGSATPNGEQAYRFKHALLHDVAYASVPPLLRQQYHSCIAAWLLQRHGERAAEYARLIAEHFEQADDPIAAGEWYAESAQRTRLSNALEVADCYYRKALALLPHDAQHFAQRVAMYEGLAIVLGQGARLTEAGMVYEAMRVEAESVGDVAVQARAWQRLAWVQMNQGNLRAALETATQAEVLARAGDASLELALALFRKGWALYRLGDAEAALSLGKQSFALASKLGANLEMAFSLNLIGVAYEVLGDYQQSALSKEQALTIHRALGDRRGEGIMLNNLGSTAAARGDYAAAVRLYGETLQLVRDINDREGEIYALDGLGWAHVNQAAFAVAEDYLRQSMRLAEASGLTKYSSLYAHLAEACLGQGNTGEACVLAQQALDLGREEESQGDIGLAWRVLGKAMAQMPESMGARACFTESLRIFREMRAEVEVGRTLREWARYEWNQHERDQGNLLWQEARDLFVRLKMDLEVHVTDALR